MRTTWSSLQSQRASIHTNTSGCRNNFWKNIGWNSWKNSEEVVKKSRKEGNSQEGGRSLEILSWNPSPFVHSPVQKEYLNKSWKEFLKESRKKPWKEFWKQSRNQFLKQARNTTSDVILEEILGEIFWSIVEEQEEEIPRRTTYRRRS